MKYNWPTIIGFITGIALVAGICDLSSCASQATKDAQTAAVAAAAAAATQPAPAAVQQQLALAAAQAAAANAAAATQPTPANLDAVAKLNALLASLQVQLSQSQIANAALTDANNKLAASRAADSAANAGVAQNVLNTGAAAATATGNPIGLLIGLGLAAVAAGFGAYKTSKANAATTVAQAAQAATQAGAHAIVNSIDAAAAQNPTFAKALNDVKPILSAIQSQVPMAEPLVNQAQAVSAARAAA